MARKRYLAGIVMAAFLLSACAAQPQSANIPGWESTRAVYDAQQTLAAQKGAALPFIPTATPTQPPTPTPEFVEPPPAADISAAAPRPSATPLNNKAKAMAPECKNAAVFVDDVNIPDNTSLKAGSRFIKTWRLKNTGTCTWNRNYQLVFVNGDALGGLISMPLNQEVKPGQTVDISIPFTCPMDEGSFQSNWMIKDEFGGVFGTGEYGDSPFYVLIDVTSSVPWGLNCGGGG